MAVSNELERKLQEVILSYHCVLKHYSANDEGRVTLKLWVSDDQYVRAARTKLQSKKWLGISVVPIDNSGKEIKEEWEDLGFVMFQHFSAPEEGATVTFKAELASFELTPEQHNRLKKRDLRVTLIPSELLVSKENVATVE